MVNLSIAVAPFLLPNKSKPFLTMFTVKIFGQHDARTLELKTNVEVAFRKFPVKTNILEISEPNIILENGIDSTPALMVDGVLILEGRVASPEEIIALIENRDLISSKLFNIRKIVVPVDLSENAAEALCYALNLAKVISCDIEVVYVMDSIFEGEKPSSSGFLSGYKKTMQQEVDGFIQKTLESEGISYSPEERAIHGPITGEAPAIHSTVLYGFPDATLIEYSQHADFIVMGTTGRGTIGKKLFGSISLEVSKNAHAPVLLTPPGAKFKGLQNILYSSNFESLEISRIQQAVAFANQFNAQLHFVHVGKPGDTGVELEKKLFEIHFKYAKGNSPFLFTNLVGEDVVEQLYEYSMNHKIDLMVFVTHHRNFWEAIVHHSITRDVLFDAFIPVMVLHKSADKKV